MKKSNFLKLILTGFLSLFFLFNANAQSDTCSPKTCTGTYWPNPADYQIYAKLQQINLKTTGSYTVSNMLRQSTQDSINKALRESSLQSAFVLNNNSVFKWTVTGSIVKVPFYQTVSGRNAFLDTISGKFLSVANTTYSTSVTLGTYAPYLKGIGNYASYGTIYPSNFGTEQRIIKNGANYYGKSVFLDTKDSSVFINGDGYLKTIDSKLAGTLTVTTTGVTTAVTYSYVTVAGTNTVTTGARMVSICNTGGNNANFNGTTLPPGACISLPEVVGILKPQITYDCLTSTLTVLVER